MFKVFINNIPILIAKNSSVLEACEALGIYIPRFCYHERLNVAGNCRMCLVEIEKAPKPIASCAFPIAPNMKVYTETPMVQKARENVMEFLLLNHPLDCPICDQGGECDLQEQAMLFGSDRSRFFYAKRGVEDKNCGPLVKTIMTRCIHCTRCVRFFQEVAGQEDFGTTLRGRETEIGTYVGKVLNSELSGNVIDLCPVGALTSKPYAFTARPWEIKTVETIDVCDSIGSNIKINFKETEVLRILPSVNDSLNEEWLSDKARFCIDALKTERITSPFIKQANKLVAFNWESKEFAEAYKNSIFNFNSLNKEQMLFICGNNVDLETIQYLKHVAQTFGISLVAEDYLSMDSNLMVNAKLNTTFSEILNSDLCLTIGTNTRFEASLLNVRLKKRIKLGNYEKQSIGLSEILTYDNQSIGNSLKTLLEIVEGNHLFCQKLVKAKKPVIIFGSSFKKRVDGNVLNLLIAKLSRAVKIVDEEWLGVNFLPLSANKVGEFLVGVNSQNKQNYGEIQYIHAVGMDSSNRFLTKFEKTSATIIVQTPFSEPELKRADIVFPSTVFSEKEGTYINLEGLAQKTRKVFSGPGFAKNDSLILESLFHEILDNFSKKKTLYTLSPINNKKIFTKHLFSQTQLKFGKFKKTPFKASIFNFFSNSLLTRKSQTLSKCASNFKKNYLNFIN